MSRYLRFPVTIVFPMLDGETKSQAEDRMIERIDPEGNMAIGWSEPDVTVEEDDDEE